MYSTCLFCHASLGANTAIEHFPIGRRLAFDAVHGRLWAVCRKCERWNLSPLEERWEAIEECDRLFTDTRLRVSTDNIGLGRIGEGLELVRIGAPLRPEMAAWRYGDQFGRRRVRQAIYVGAGVTVGAGLLVLGPVTGILAGGAASALFNTANAMSTLYRQRRVRATLALPGHDKPVPIRQQQLHRSSIVTEDGRWALRVAYSAAGKMPIPLSNGRSLQLPRFSSSHEEAALLTGDDALHAAGKLLPAINAGGANKSQVASAVKLMGDAADASELFGRVGVGRALQKRVFGTKAEPVPGHRLSTLPAELRLALEMATHEESERRALEGELALLEAEWRQAEEIAAIADDLFVSDDTRARLSELKGRDEPHAS